MPRKTLKQRRERDAAKEQQDFGFDKNPAHLANRIEGNDINLRTNDPEEMMLEIMERLNDTVTPIPEVGKFYTFVYNAKTPGKQYDQHPLIAWILFTGPSSNPKSSCSLAASLSLLCLSVFLGIT